MSMDADAYAHCDDCDRMAFDPQPCGTCGPSSRYCTAHATKCAICGETYCDEHAPDHRVACQQINHPMNHPMNERMSA